MEQPPAQIIKQKSRKKLADNWHSPASFDLIARPLFLEISLEHDIVNLYTHQTCTFGVSVHSIQIPFCPGAEQNTIIKCETFWKLVRSLSRFGVPNFGVWILQYK